MKVNFITNTLHRFHHRFKKAYLVVFGLSFLLVAVLSQQAHGESVVGSVQTKITYTFGDTKITFVTTEGTVENALSAYGIKLGKNDVTEPPLDTHLIGGNISVSLVPAMPVLIDDNGQSWVGMSAYTDKNAILNQLGVDVDKADIVTIELIMEPNVDNMIGQKITIKRAPVYTVMVDGGEIVVHSWSKTVGDVLTDGGITLNQNDTTSLAKDALSPTSGQIIVTRVNYADIEEAEIVGYDTIYKIDTSLGLKGERIDQAGNNGKLVNKYHVIYHNGVIVSKTLVSSETIVTPNNRIISKGAEKGYINFGYYSGMVSSFHTGYKGHHFLVTNLDNGRQVTVVSIGSGPFDGGLMDMGTEPFQMLGGSLSAGRLYNIAVQMLD